MTASETLADWVIGLRYADIDAPTVAYARELLLDHLGCAARGGTEPWPGPGSSTYDMTSFQPACESVCRETPAVRATSWIGTRRGSVLSGTAHLLFADVRVCPPEPDRA